jgi:hypothetical protein
VPVLAGEAVQLTTDSGCELVVDVPEGVGPGDEFEVQVEIPPPEEEVEAEE